MEQRLEIGFVEKIDIANIVKDVLHQWWVILILSLSVAFFANIWAIETYNPRYQTTTTFTVTARGFNNNIYQNLNATKDLAGRFSLILNSNLMKKKVAEELGQTELQAWTTVVQVPETNLLIFTVTAGSAMKAYRTMDVIMDNYNTVSDYAIGDVILEIIQHPLIPEQPVNPLQEKKVMILGFLAAAAVFTFFFASLSYFKDTVKNPKDFLRKIDARLLGVIYHEKKKKKSSMLIQNPIRSFRFVESNRMTAAKIRSRLEQEQKKIVMITSVMEDEGKSTIAANLALALAQEHKKVLLIDCDFRKPSQYKIFQVSESETFNLPKILKNSEESLNVWRNKDIFTIFNSVPSASATDEIDYQWLKRIFEYLKEQMDYIIIDSSPMALVSDTEELAQTVDASILVVRQDRALTRLINDTIDDLNHTQAKVLGCVFNDAAVENSAERGSYSSGKTYGYGGYYGKRTK